MKKEISAGGLIVRNQSHMREILVIKDMKGNWTFPKGIIDRGENAEQAAIREIREETGMTDVTLIKPLSTIHYMYQRHGLIDKTVYYFLFTSEGKEELKPQTEEGIHEIRWISLPEAKEIIGYPKTNLSLLAEIDNFKFSLEDL